MISCSRQLDPFIAGRADIDGRYSRQWLEKIFVEVEDVRENNRQASPDVMQKIKLVLEYLRENGETKTKHLAKISGLSTARIKLLLTYDYPVYESDDGYTLGILDG